MRYQAISELRGLSESGLKKSKSKKSSNHHVEVCTAEF